MSASFQTIFEEYYTLFRGDSDVPSTTDSEWTIAVRFGNTALRRLQEVDAEDWDWLWTTASDEGESHTYTTGTDQPTLTTYDGPTDMVRPGGWVKVVNPADGSFFHIDVIPAYNVQRMAQAAPYAYWTGGAQTGYSLHINLQGTTYNGWTIDFPYYKALTLFNVRSGTTPGTVAEDGTTVTECPDPNYLIQSILAYRYRSTRNYPSYQTAKEDADTALQQMQMKNRKGVDGHSFNLTDTSSGVFGI